MKTINSLRSKLFALTLALMASVSTFAYDYHGDLLCYNILTDSTVAVTGQSEYKTMPRYEYLPENLVIPSEVTLQGKAYKVVSIDQWAFYACTMLKSVTIPSSVTFIGLSAFQYCENLVNVDIPTSVTTVEGSAFSYTKWYDNLPDGEVYINNTLYRYKGTAPENTQIVVKDGTTRIAGFTFWNQSNIVSIELPQTLTDIEHGAFEGCTQLSSILIPKNVTFIGCSAFAECIGLMEVICLAPTPPIAGVSANPSPSDWMFAGVDIANVRLYVPMESIELYRNADQWKDFQIRIYYGSEECHEYMHVNLTALPLITGKLTYRLSTDDGSEIPYVDSVWILNTDKEPLRKFYAQSGDTIDLLFLERGTYILNVYLNECIKSRTFVHRPKWKYTWCNTWNVMEHDMGMTSDTEKTWRHYLANDTIINGQTYTSVNYYWTLEESKVYKIAHVRFSEDKKVYALMDDTEYLVYDFSVQVGDTIETIVGAFYGSMLQQLLVHQIDIDEETNRKTIILFPICKCDEDLYCLYDLPIIWIEGVGTTDGFLMGYPPCDWVGGIGCDLLCAYQGDELKYTGDLYDEYGCEYNATEQKPEDLFPTLWGLQRTSFTEYSECSDSYASLFQSKGETITINDNQYLKFGGHYLREENKQVLLYSRLQDKDLVLYDYSLEVGDTLTTLNIDYRIEGIPFDLCYVDYAYEDVGMSHSIDTLIVTDVSYVTLLDGKEHKQWTFDNGMQYVEGIGNFGQSRWSGNFFGLVKEPAIPTCLMGEHLVCISKNNKLLYQMDGAEMERLGTECLCQAEQNPEDLFPTLWGLQRTSCSEYVDCQENETYLMQADEIKEINGKLYLKYGGVFLREEDSKVLIYSFPYEKDFVLYDWTLGIGDTLQILGIDPFSFPELEYTAVVDYVAFEEYDANGNRTIVKKPLGNKRVKDISTIRLLDGNEYKAWLFGYDWERGNYYVEGIGNASKYGGDYVDLVYPFEVPSCYYGERLVCVSRDGVLLYQMDEAEMERLGAECLCDYNSGPKKDNAKNGKIGGRPTPTQWNMLEVETKEMDGTPTILRAETFSYTLENDSIVTNNKTFYQLARQSTKDTATTKSFVGALHFGEGEDNRVYFLHNGVEYVLYDFTAEPGDTVEIFAGINNYPHDSVYTHVVTGKDTLENGACRMLLEVVFPEEIGSDLEQQYLQKVWLAGLGSIDGIVHNAASRATKARSSETQTSVMLCAWRDDDCLYTTDYPDYDSYGCVYNLPTSIKDIETPGGKYQKIIRDGQLYILRDNKLYDVLGTPMN